MVLKVNHTTSVHGYFIQLDIETKYRCTPKDTYSNISQFSLVDACLYC